ncbi:MAG: glycosyltransferase family 4 protein [Bacteroidia bacterium]|nr:glycosyltransferase family 4 protein [Bacteroidia bacterium]
MKIMVNTRLLLHNQMEGMGIFTHELLRRLVCNHPEHEFIFVFDRNPDARFRYADNVRLISSFPPARHPFLWYIWLRFTLPFLLRKWKPDVFFSPDGFLPIGTRVPCVNVIHDINFEYRQDLLPSNVMAFYKKYFPRFARESTQLVTVSEFSAKTLEEKYGIPATGIAVVSNAAGPQFMRAGQEAQQQIRQKYTNGNPYFLYLGSLNPRKNLTNLLTAYEQFAAESDHDVQLLIAGVPMHGTNTLAIEKRIKTNPRIHFIGRVTEAELPAVYSAALALVYIPLFEGFGIPVIEAMQCGTPVITSSVTSLPETAGGAALLADPQRPDDIAQKMKQLYSDPGLRQDLSGAGLKNASRFSWNQSADVLWKLITDAAERK